MKKLLSVLFVLMMTMSCAVPCIADQGYVRFVPDILNVIEYTTEEWMKSGLDRALLTLLF